MVARGHRRSCVVGVWLNQCGSCDCWCKLLEGVGYDVCSYIVVIVEGRVRS